LKEHRHGRRKNGELKEKPLPQMRKKGRKRILPKKNDKLLLKEQLTSHELKWPRTGTDQSPAPATKDRRKGKKTSP